MNKRTILFSLCVVILANSIYSQQSITGANCVIPGPLYQYDLKISLDGVTPVNVCVTGGTIEGQSSDCIQNNALSYLRINWNANVATAKISLSYGSLKDSIVVYLTSPLFAGLIDTGLKVQAIRDGSIPIQITCTAPSGGNCNPQYSFQWQQSQDAQNWQDIVGATDGNYSFTESLNQTTFFRRKTKENNSHSIGYSSEAVVVVLPADVREGN